MRGLPCKHATVKSDQTDGGARNHEAEGALVFGVLRCPCRQVRAAFVLTLCLRRADAVLTMC